MVHVVGRVGLSTSRHFTLTWVFVSPAMGILMDGFRDFFLRSLSGGYLVTYVDTGAETGSEEG